MTWRIATEQQLILSNAATFRSSGCWLGENASEKWQRAPETRANWIRILARRYNQDGPRALADQRQHNKGASPLLSGEQQGKLHHALELRAPDHGLWTGPKVADWMGEQTGQKIPPQRGWDYLKRAGFSLHIPCPRHHKAEKEKQEAFKRELPEQVQQIRQLHPQAQVELWCMDEHRIGLKPVVRRVWAGKGRRPIVRVHQRYEWLYVSGFVHPESGETRVSAPPHGQCGCFLHCDFSTLRQPLEPV